MKNLNLKYTFITILLGALGSGLWALITNVLAPKLTNYLIRVSDAFSEQIFRKIAINDTVFLQQTTYSLIILICVFLLIISSAFIYAGMSYTKTKFDKTKADVNRLGDDFFEREDIASNISAEDFAQDYTHLVEEFKSTEKLVSRVSLLVKITTPLIIITTVIIYTYAELTSRYVYNSISYFNYLLKVNSVNLDEENERKYISRFTQINSSKDYMTIIRELEGLALNNKLSFIPNPNIRSKEDILREHPNTKNY